MNPTKRINPGKLRWMERCFTRQRPSASLDFYCSSLHRIYSVLILTMSTATDKAARRKRFEDVFPVIAEELSQYLKGEGMPKDAVDWYEKVSLPTAS